MSFAKPPKMVTYLCLLKTANFMSPPRVPPAPLPHPPPPWTPLDPPRIQDTPMLGPLTRHRGWGAIFHVYVGWPC